MKNIVSLYVEEPSLLGDKAISDTFDFLLHRITEEIKEPSSIKIGNMLPPSVHYKELKQFQRTLRKVLDILYYKSILSQKLTENLFFLASIYFWAKYTKTNSEIQEYYNNMLKDADVVIFAGGGIFQHSYMQLWRGIYPVIEYCKKHKIPVYFNAIGIEKPSVFIEHLLYKYLLNQKCVKAVTTRDDINYLKGLVQNKKMCKQILDPALWAQECYTVKKADSDLIGIGIIRPKIFSDSELMFCCKDAENMQLNIIKEIDRRGYKWELFCNGSDVDYEFGLKLLKILNKPANLIAPKPTDADQLVNRIKTYKAVAASRLHANIIATSLGIPTVGIVWNKKLTRFSEFIQTASTFITPDKFNDSIYIVNQLEIAMKQGLNRDRINFLKEDSYNTMKNILTKILTKK